MTTVLVFIRLTELYIEKMKTAANGDGTKFMENSW